MLEKKTIKKKNSRKKRRGKKGKEASKVCFTPETAEQNFFRKKVKRNCDEIKAPKKKMSLRLEEKEEEKKKKRKKKEKTEN